MQVLTRTLSDLARNMRRDVQRGRVAPPVTVGKIGGVVFVLQALSESDALDADVPGMRPANECLVE